MGRPGRVRAFRGSTPRWEPHWSTAQLEIPPAATAAAAPPRTTPHRSAPPGGPRAARAGRAGRRGAGGGGAAAFLSSIVPKAGVNHCAVLPNVARLLAPRGGRVPRSSQRGGHGPRVRPKRPFSCTRHCSAEITLAPRGTGTRGSPRPGAAPRPSGPPSGGPCLPAGENEHHAEGKAPSSSAVPKQAPTGAQLPVPSRYLLRSPLFHLWGRSPPPPARIPSGLCSLQHRSRLLPERGDVGSGPGAEVRGGSGRCLGGSGGSQEGFAARSQAGPLPLCLRISLGTFYSGVNY